MRLIMEPEKSSALESGEVAGNVENEILKYIFKVKLIEIPSVVEF